MARTNGRWRILAMASTHMRMRNAMSRKGLAPATEKLRATSASVRRWHGHLFWGVGSSKKLYCTPPLGHILYSSPAATAFQWLALSYWLAKCLSLLDCFVFAIPFLSLSLSRSRVRKSAKCMCFAPLSEGHATHTGTIFWFEGTLRPYGPLGPSRYRELPRRHRVASSSL